MFGLVRTNVISNRRYVTFYGEADVYEKFKKLLNAKEPGRKISEELNNLMKKRIMELEGRPDQEIDPVEYEALKRQHSRLDKDEETLTKKLRKRKVYDDLCSLAYKLGLDFKNCSNADEVAPKLLKEWDGGGDIHEFITLTETIWEKRQVERRLAEIRMKNFAAGEETEEPKPAKRGRKREGSEPVDMQAEAEGEEESEDGWEEECSRV
ncbi:MAG: hypothetical protein QXF26_08020 [Candidatus Bathyarchaeia archaeon]